MAAGGWPLVGPWWIAVAGCLLFGPTTVHGFELSQVSVNDSDVNSLNDSESNRTYYAYPNPIHYRDPLVKNGYRSSDTFDAKGMQPVYFLAELFLDVIQLDNLPLGKDFACFIFSFFFCFKKLHFIDGTVHFLHSW